MRQIQLATRKFSNPAVYALVSDEDYELVSKYSWNYANFNKIYAYTYFKKKLIKMHILLMGRKDNLTIDHINGNGLDNRRENLRWATNTQQQANKVKAAGKSSKYKGVIWYKATNCWQVRIKRKGKQKFIGYFDDEKNAARAYNEAAKKLFGEFALLNEIED